MDDQSPISISSGLPAQWDTSSHEEFLRYYAEQSVSPKSMERFRLTCHMLLRQIQSQRQLEVLDIGCGAGAQCRFWLDSGHRYRGIDINQPLIELARHRAMELQFDAIFDVGTATALPFPDQSMDVVLLPELLEHVADWQPCIDEAVRVVRPGGLVYLSTTNKLCPRQQEFNLPCYSWYPATVKRYVERRAVTDWPAVANFAKYPAVNWFTFYQLQSFLSPKGIDCKDRFDIMDLANKPFAIRAVVGLVKALPPLRWLAHVATPNTVVVGIKH